MMNFFLIYLIATQAGSQNTKFGEKKLYYSTMYHSQAQRQLGTTEVKSVKSENILLSINGQLLSLGFNGFND